MFTRFNSNCIMIIHVYKGKKYVLRKKKLHSNVTGSSDLHTFRNISFKTTSYLSDCKCSNNNVWIFLTAKVFDSDWPIFHLLIQYLRPETWNTLQIQNKKCGLDFLTRHVESSQFTTVIQSKEIS